MEIVFLALLVVMLACALGSGYPVAFAIPGSAILTIALAALSGYLFSGDADAFFIQGGGPRSWLSAGVSNFRDVYRSDDSDILIAIPLFVFMGHMLQRSRVAEDLLLAMAQLFGAIRGGLGISAIVVGALLAATTGIVGATVVAMGMISLPTMLRNNYSKPLATGVIAATGTLGQIIPPSIVLLILVQQLTTAVNQAGIQRRALYKASSGELVMPTEFDVSSVSAGEMFMGAFIPGMLLVGLFMLYVLVHAFLSPQLAPALTKYEKWDGQLAIRVMVALVPPLALILLVLGSIVAGVATVNQAGAIGAAGATVMAGYRLREGKRGAFAPTVITILSLCAIGLIVNIFNVNLRKIDTSDDVLGVVLAAIAVVLLAFALCWSGWRTLKIEHTMKRVVDETTKTTSLIFFILLGAVMLTAAFRGFGGDEIVRDFLQKLPGGFWGQFTIVMLIIFSLGFFLDFIEITVVVVPIIAPILLADPSANVTAIWLGVMIALNIQTSFLTPPFGFALFYLRGVAPPSVSTTDIYKGVVPFIAIQLLALGVVGAYPRLVNYLPNRVLLLSESAPPTTNPRQQYCIEEYVSRRFERNGDTIRGAISQARSLDLQVLPKHLRDELEQGFERANDVFTMMSEIERTERAVSKAAVAYRPIHSKVRRLERDVRRSDQEIAELEVLVSRAGATVSEAVAQQARHRISELTAQRSAILGKIPVEWDAVSREFSAIQKASNDARRAYRHAADNAYQPISRVLAMIGGLKTLKSIGGDLRALEPLIHTEPESVVLERIGSIHAALGRTAGTAEIRKATYQARRALGAKSPKLKTAQISLARAVALFEADVAWRERAFGALLPGLKAYEAAIADTIGLRSQSRLPDHVAVDVASCRATPRDIFLNF